MTVTVVVLLAAVTLLLAVNAIRLAARMGAPSLLFYLGIGLVLGQTVFRDFDDDRVIFQLGYVALALILAEGGLTTRWADIRHSVLPAAVLATFGTVISMAVMAACIHFALGQSWLTALVIAAIVSSTDSAAVFSVLRSVSLPRRLKGVLEAESGFNDAPVVIAVTAVTSMLTHTSELPWYGHLGVAAAELVGGTLIGLVVGRLFALQLRSVALPSPGLYPIAVWGAALLAYAGASVLECSGFIAVYVAALCLGNARLPHGEAIRGFAESVGELAQIVLFVALGLVVQLDQIPGQIGPALVIGVALFVLARPLSVVGSLAWFRFSWRQLSVLSWAGMRGAVPIVLATIPASRGAPGTGNLYELVFVLVVVFTVFQAPTLPVLIRRLGVQSSTARPLDVDARPLGRLDAELLEAEIGPASRLAGVAIHELRLPRTANLALIVRDGVATVPPSDALLRAGDTVLIVVARADTERVQNRLDAVSEHGRLAGWSHPVRDAEVTRGPAWRRWVQAAWGGSSAPR